MLKRLVIALFCIQLVVLSILSVSVLNMSNVLNIIYNGNVEIILTSHDGITLDERNQFLNYMSERGVRVDRRVYLENNHVNLYTSDMSISARLPVSGRIHTTADSNIVSDIVAYLLFDFHERLNITVFDINTCLPYTDGVYVLFVNDLSELPRLLESLSDVMPYTVDIINRGVNDSSFLNILLFVSYIFFTDFSLLHIVMFFCVIAMITQYAMSRVKLSTVLQIHGYSSTKDSKNFVVDLMKLFAIPNVVAIVVFMLYGTFVIGYTLASAFRLLPLFLILCLFLVVLYTFIACVILCIGRWNTQTNTNTVLKGNIPSCPVHYITFVLRTMLCVFLLFTFSAVLSSYRLLQTRLSMQSGWDRTYNIYSLTPAFGTFQPDSLDREKNIFDDIIMLHEYLSRNFSSFIINSQSFLIREVFGAENRGMESQLDLHTNLRVSPNYFLFNPIYAVDDTPVHDRIVFDDYVLNIVVPISLYFYHDIIEDHFLHLFHFNKVEVENIYNNEFDLMTNTTHINELSINIIYAHYDQSYFTLNTMMRSREYINLIDPIVVVYTGSEHASFLFSSFTTSYFVLSETGNLRYELTPIMERYDFLRGAFYYESIYRTNSRIVLEFQGEFTKNLALLILLFFIHLIITVMLMLSFIEKNKYTLHLKSLFGYGFWRRNKIFVIYLFVFNGMTVCLLIPFLGTNAAIVLVLLVCLLVFDFAVYFIIERKITDKSFNSITKNEH